jgi:hypothetical protein
MRLALGVAVLGSVVGCGVSRVVGPTPDTFTTWSLTPLPPDPTLAQQAMNPQSSCNSGPGGPPTQIVLQDRRTAQTAAFMFSGVNVFGSCILTSGTGSSGGSGPALEAMTGKLSIEANAGGGGVDEATKLRELGGRVAPEATKVVIQLADGRSIVASLANGYWLAWWPDVVKAERVVATDATGAEVGSIEVPG